MNFEYTMDHLKWYELGIRMTQADIVFSYDMDETTVTDTLPLNSLDRLISAIDQLPDFQSDHRHWDKIVDDIFWCRRRWRKVSTVEEAERTIGQVRSCLNHLTGKLDLVSEQLKRPDRQWFHLGREIANGLGGTEVNNAQTFDEPNRLTPDVHRGRERICWPPLVFPSVPTSRWTWNREDQVRESINQLPCTLTSVFPALSGDADVSVLQAEEFPSDLWGWEAIELGLCQMKQSVSSRLPTIPHWDSNDMTLWVGNQVARKFAKKTSNQVRVIETFQRLGWPSQVSDPFSCPARQNETIRALNKTVDRDLIRFGGDGSGGIRWDYGPEAQLGHDSN